MARSFLLIVLAATCFSWSYAQTAAKAPLGKEITGRDIEWNDFEGEIDRSSEWDAQTNWVTTYRFPAPEFRNGQAFVKVTVSVFLKPDSWVKPDKKSDRLLEHERGHYNIGRICAKQIEATINSTPFSPTNYAKEINDTYLLVIGRCQEFEKLYDSETSHYRDREQQARWNDKIRALLKD